MSRCIWSLSVMAFYLLSAQCASVVGADSTRNKDRVRRANIVLTRLDVNDTALTLDFRVRNQSDHAIWICDGLGLERPFEVYLAKDGQTLKVRRRFDLPNTFAWGEPPYGKYVRLAPEEERAESLSLRLPIDPHVVFWFDELGSGQRATRVVLEIGFYDEDLPTLVYGILAMAERCPVAIVDTNRWLIEHYFPGFLLRESLGALSSFKARHEREVAQGQLTMAYAWDFRLGEKVLQIEVSGVHIPYNAPALVNATCDTTSQTGR